jgi:uncharacterized repeat protein (TIGR02543 family)
MRKIHALLVLLSLPLVSMGQVTEGQWTYIIEDGGATITASTATGAVTIPSILGGLPVLKVGSGSYIFGVPNTSVTSVVIPNSVTSIGRVAFLGSSALTRVVIGNNVTSIGPGAFVECEALTSVTIGSSVTSIEDDAFKQCYALSSIIIPNSVTIIGNGAFWYCNSLTSITIGNSVTSIGNVAFYNCNRLTDITIPSSVTSIGGWAFDECTRLSTVLFLGNPPTTGSEIFRGSTPTIYYMAEATGWSSTYAGRPAYEAGTGTLTVTCDSGKGTYTKTPDRAYYILGTQVTVAATPKNGYLFTAWSGDSTGPNTSITLTVRSGSSVTANFSQDTRDNDNDGLTNFQEYITYGTNPNQKDSNSDGYEDGVVVSLGYSPTLNFSALTAHWKINPPTGLYTSSQYSENYTAGQQSVISNPNIYNLYTITQYNDNLATGFNAGREAGKAEGRAEVTSFPFSYSLYTATQYIANFLAGQHSVLFSPNIYNLYTAQQYANNFTAGKDSVLNSPNSNGLYTTSQIQDMSMGGLVLSKNGNGFTLNYSIEKSNDLAAWTQYQSFALPLTGLSPDKAFVRLKMANSSSGSSSQAADQAAAQAALAAAQAAQEAARAALYQAEQAQREAMLRDAQANLAAAQANLAAAQASGDPAAQAAAQANLTAAQANLTAAQASAQGIPSLY